MKKILRKILAVSASLLLLSSFVSCGEGEDDDDKSGPVVPGGSTGGGGSGGTSGADLWKNAEMLTELANTEYNWAELKIDSEIASRLQVGSKVIFEIADCNSFSKFRVTKGWGQVGNGKIGDPSSSTPYYKIDGTKLNAKEALDAGNPDNNHPGTWENEPGEPGTYYFVVDAANLSALKSGFDIVGCFKCVKIGITNLAAPIVPEEIADFATDGIGDVVTFNVSKAALTKDHNKITLRYLRSAKSAKEKITLKDAVYYVQCNNGKIEKKTGDIKFALNPYGGCFDFGEDYKEGTPVTDAMRTASGKYTGNSLNEPEVDANEYNFEIAYNPKQFAVGDVVKFQLVSAKVTGEGAAKINDIKKKIKAILVDGSENAGKESGVSPTGWYEELTAQLADVVYPRVIKDSAVIEAVDGPVVDAGLLDEPGDLDWSAGVAVSASKFADVTGNKKIVITYTSNKDNDYHKFKMMAGTELYAGIATGFSIDLTAKNADDLHGCSFTNAPSADAQTMSYQPHETEWTKIKASGFKLIGYGAKITKIEVADSDVANPSGEIETVPSGNTEEPVAGGETETPPDVTADYSAKNLDVTTVTNTYSASTHGIQAKMTVRTGDNLKGLAAGDKFTVVMKGTSTKAFVPQVYFMDNTAAGNYTNLGEWGDTINITTDAFEVTKEITLKKAPSSDDADAFMFVIDYDEKGASADIENATITFSEFTITKQAAKSEPEQADPNVVYEQKNMTIELPVNAYGEPVEDHGIQCYVKLSDLGITGFTPAVGETYTIYMKGTTDNASTNVSGMCVGFTIGYSWDNGAMDGGLDISETSLAAGVSKDVTFKGDLTNASDLAFWLYNTTAGTPKTMLTFSEFKITKKVSE